MILIDLLLITFLGICIYYCFVLNKRINELQNSKNEFLRTVREFDMAIVRAESSISDLTKLSRETSAKIHKATEKAQFLINDITFMNDMGSDVASRLEKAIDVAKTLEKRLNIHSYAVTSPVQAIDSLNPREEIENIMTRFAANRVNQPTEADSQSKAYQQLIRQAK